MSNRERAQQIADEHNNDAYSVALAMLEEIKKDKNEKTDLIFVLGLCVDVMPAGQARAAALRVLNPYYRPTGEPK